MIVRLTWVSCVVSAFALAVIFTPTAAQTQGRGSTQVQKGERADLSRGLASYDQLAGLPCTTAVGTQSTVSLVGMMKTPMCGGMSLNGRFLDLGSIVIDQQTNLMWEKKAQAGDLHGVGNTYSWCEATGNSVTACAGNTLSWIDRVNAEGFAGFKDWRVPKWDELLGIVDTTACGSGTPCIDPIFGPTQPSLYWSSDELSMDIAFFVVFFDTGVGDDHKALSYLVRAVRSGP